MVIDTGLDGSEYMYEDYDLNASPQWVNEKKKEIPVFSGSDITDIYLVNEERNANEEQDKYTENLEMVGKIKTTDDCFYFYSSAEYHHGYGHIDDGWKRKALEMSKSWSNLFCDGIPKGKLRSMYCDKYPYFRGMLKDFVEYRDKSTME